MVTAQRKSTALTSGRSLSRQDLAQWRDAARVGRSACGAKSRRCPPNNVLQVEFNESSLSVNRITREGDSAESTTTAQRSPNAGKPSVGRRALLLAAFIHKKNMCVNVWWKRVSCRNAQRSRGGEPVRTRWSPMRRSSTDQWKPNSVTQRWRDNPLSVSATAVGLFSLGPPKGIARARLQSHEPPYLSGYICPIHRNLVAAAHLTSREPTPAKIVPCVLASQFRFVCLS